MIMEILITINHEYHDYQDYTYAYICIHMHIYACIDAQNHSDNNYSNNNSSDNSDNCSIDNTKYSGIFNNIPIWVIILRDVHVLSAPILFPQQRKLTGSSAQNSSAVHWCRGRVRFNEVPENVPKVPEKVWEALVQSQVTFNRVPEKVPETGSLGAKPSQVQQGSGEDSGEGSEKVWEALFGAEPGQVQQGSGKGSGAGSGRLWCRARSGSTELRRRVWRWFGRLWCKARSGSTGFRRSFRRRFREALVQSQVRFVTGFRRGFRRRSGRLWCRARSGLTGFAAISFTETQLRCFQRLASQHASERLVKIKRCGCWGYHQSFFKVGK